MGNISPEEQAKIDAAKAELNRRFGGGVGGRLGEQIQLGKEIQGGPQRTDQFGGKTWDDNVAGYRSTGAGLAGRAGPTLDQGQANEARTHQLGSLEMLTNAARGNAPSQAAMVGQGLTSTTMGAGMAAGGAARGGPGAQIAGMRTAMAGTALQNTQNLGGILAARNKEAALDMGSLAGVAAGARGQDIAAATTNAQLEAQQRALNEAGQQNYEGMAVDTRNVQQNTGMVAQDQHNNNVATLNAIRANERANEEGNLKTAGSAFLGAATGGASAAAQAAAARKKKV